MSDCIPASFVRPDLDVFCALDSLGLKVEGMRHDPPPADGNPATITLACRAQTSPADALCHICGAHASVRDTRTRTFTHLPYGERPTILSVRYLRYRCSTCTRVWSQDLRRISPPKTRITHTIVWIRTAGHRFSEEFAYEYPNTGILDNLGGTQNPGWRKAYPALLCPKETVRDWHRWRHGIPGVKGSKHKHPNAFERADIPPVPTREWQSWILRDALLYRPASLSEAMTFNMPGLSLASAEAFILAHGLDTEPPGYEAAIATKTVAANAPY